MAKKRDWRPPVPLDESPTSGTAGLSTKFNVWRRWAFSASRDGGRPGDQLRRDHLLSFCHALNASWTCSVPVSETEQKGTEQKGPRRMETPGAFRQAEEEDPPPVNARQNARFGWASRELPARPSQHWAS